MSKQFARELIRKEFIQLLNNKEFNKITITEIVENCDLNRNTFYYYYSNLLEVLSEVFDHALHKITGPYFEGKSWAYILLQLTQFAKTNKKAVLHVYHSLQREELERFLDTFTHRILKKFIEDEAKDIKVKSFDKDLIVKILQMALLGMLIDWINHGMQSDIDLVISRTEILFKGKIKHLLKNTNI